MFVMVEDENNFKMVLLNTDTIVCVKDDEYHSECYLVQTPKGNISVDAHNFEKILEAMISEGKFDRCSKRDALNYLT